MLEEASKWWIFGYKWWPGHLYTRSQSISLMGRNILVNCHNKFTILDPVVLLIKSLFAHFWDFALIMTLQPGTQVPVFLVRNRVTAAPVSLVFCPVTVSVFNDGVLMKSAEHQTAQRQSWQQTCEQNGAQEATLRFTLRQHWLKRKLISRW